MPEFAVFSYCPDCNEFKVLPCTCEKKPAPAPEKPAKKAAAPVAEDTPDPVASTVANTVTDTPVSPAKTDK